MNIQQKLIQNNFSRGRAGHKIKRIILHTTAGGGRLYNWFNRPSTRASAHYSIPFDGSIEQYVRDQDTAWHAGSSDPHHPNNNLESIGIEHEDGGNWQDGVRTPALYESSAQLVALLSRRYGVPLKLLAEHQKWGSGISLHKYYANKACPGGLDIHRIINRAKQINNSTSQSNNNMNNKIVAQHGWGVSHLSQAAGYDPRDQSKWTYIANLNGYATWQDLQSEFASGAAIGREFKVREDKPKDEPSKVDNEAVQKLEEQLKQKEEEVSNLNNQIKTIEEQKEKAELEKQNEIDKIKLEKESEILKHQEEINKLYEEIHYIEDKYVQLPDIPEVVHITNEQFKQYSPTIKDRISQSIDNIFAFIDGKQSFRKTVAKVLKATGWIVIAYILTLVLNGVEGVDIPLEYSGVVNVLMYGGYVIRGELMERGGLSKSQDS